MRERQHLRLGSGIGGAVQSLGRHAATHLVNAGLSEFVAADADDYVAKAVAWANDPEELAQLRGSLRDQLAQSPVCDQERFADNLEEAFYYMIRQS